tara:strand:- start:2779 stop:2943 length:165 start_codon:yes stop_codon:yes gene_type:complete
MPTMQKNKFNENSVLKKYLFFVNNENRKIEAIIKIINLSKTHNVQAARPLTKSK